MGRRRLCGRGGFTSTRFAGSRRDGDLSGVMDTPGRVERIEGPFVSRHSATLYSLRQTR